MKTIDAGQMEKAARVAKSVTRDLGVLNCVRIESSYEGLTFESTNLETYARLRFDSTDTGLSDYGVSYVDGAVLAATLKGQKGLTGVTVTPEGLTIGGASIVGVDPLENETQEFSPAGLEEVQGFASWSGKSFKAAVKRWAAVAKGPGQTSRTSLQGLYIEFNENATELVACDGYQLLRESFNAGTLPQPAQGAGSMDRAIFKRDNPKDCGLFAVNEIKRILPVIKPKDSVLFTVLREKGATAGEQTGKWLRIDVFSSWGDSRLYIRGAVDLYPDYRRVIPQGNDTFHCRIYAPDLGPVATAARQAAPKDTGKCTIEVNPGNPQRLEITSSNGVSEYNSGLAVDPVSGAGLELTGINSKLLENVASFAGDVVVRLYWAGPLQAIRFELKTPDGVNCTYVVMPVSLTA